MKIQNNRFYVSESFESRTSNSRFRIRFRFFNEFFPYSLSFILNLGEKAGLALEPKAETDQRHLRYYVRRLIACECFRNNVKDNINCFGICSGPPVCRKLRFLVSRGQGNPPAAPKGEEGVAVSGDEAESVGLEPALLLPLSSTLLLLSSWPPSPSLSPQSSASPSHSVAAAVVVGATAAGTREGVEEVLSTTWDLPPTERELSHWFLAGWRNLCPNL
jgi:hypothetical protein